MPNNSDELPPEVIASVNNARAARKRVQAQDPCFFAAVSSAMFQHDLIGINFTDNTDEYDAEAGTVIPRLSTCLNAEDVARVLREEFQKWFGIETVIEVSAYYALANDIWMLLRRRDA